jgi:hypothetical protein
MSEHHPDFYADTCDRNGCEAPVVAVVADFVEDVDEGTREVDAIHGFCSDHKRDSKTRQVFSPDKDLPF